MAPRNRSIRLPTQQDVLAWTADMNSLGGSNVEHRLRPLVAALDLPMDKDADSRGDRKGKAFNKAELIAALLAYKAGIVYGVGSDDAAAASVEPKAIHAHNLAPDSLEPWPTQHQTTLHIHLHRRPGRQSLTAEFCT